MRKIYTTNKTAQPVSLERVFQGNAIFLYFLDTDVGINTPLLLPHYSVVPCLYAPCIIVAVIEVGGWLLLVNWAHFPRPMVVAMVAV